jgi:hypothetical protein
MNVSWFWDWLSELGDEIKINPIGITDEEIKINEKMYDDMLDKVIEDAFDEYITYVVFDKPKGIQNKDIDFNEDDPFGYAYDKMIECIKKYPRIYEIKRIDGYEDDEDEN